MDIQPRPDERVDPLRLMPSRGPAQALHVPNEHPGSTRQHHRTRRVLQQHPQHAARGQDDHRGRCNGQLARTLVYILRPSTAFSYTSHGVRAERDPQTGSLKVVRSNLTLLRWLQVISSFLFAGGRGPWHEYLDIASRWVESVLQDPRHPTPRHALRNASESSRFIIRATFWFDTLAAISQVSPKPGPKPVPLQGPLRNADR